MERKNIKALIFPIISLAIFTLLIFGAAYAYFSGSTTMITSNYQVNLPQTTSLICQKTDCSVTITPAMMLNTNTNASTSKSTSTCAVNCTCSGSAGATCNYNVTLLSGSTEYLPSYGLGSNKEFTVKVTSPSGCTAQNSSSTATQVNTLARKVVSNCSLTVPSGGSVSANVTAEFKWYNLDLDQTVHSTLSYSYQLKSGDILPEGYQQVEYIKNSGTQYIDTGILPSANYAFDIVYKDDNVSSSNYVMAARNGTSGTIYQGVSGSSSNKNISVMLHSGTTTPNNERVAGNMYHITASYTSDMKGTSKLINLTTGQVWDGVQNASSSGATTNVYVFAFNPSNIHKGISVYSLKIWNNGNLERNFIPCTHEGVAGFYDLVYGVFYPAATGSFTAGPNI